MSKRSPRVLIHSLVFSPDGVSTAYLYNDIARSIQEAGYEVVVLTTTPHYNKIQEELIKQPLDAKLFGLYYTSNFNGIKVYHVPQKKFKQTPLRLIGFVYWHILSFVLGLAIRNISLILSPSPPLTIGLLSLIFAKLKGAKVIYNVQEIYPDFLLNQGNLKNKGVIKALKLLESTVYNYSDHVTTIDQMFYNTIAPRFKDTDKLSIIPNFVDTDLYRPVQGGGAAMDERLFPDNPNILKLMYAGNIGHAQDWAPLLEVAQRLQQQSMPVEFWVIGEGVMRDSLMESVSKYRLNNIHVLPYQHRDKMPALMAYADVHFIFMTPELDTQGFPSKVYSIMACAKPLLITTGKQTPLFNFLTHTGSAFVITNSAFEQKCQEVFATIELILKQREQLVSMGEKGMQLIKAKYSKSAVTKEYVALVDRLVSN